ncbi:EAL domain-containing protein [Vibrio fluvialis]|uniref:EAL domain-containing protein n=1 Tax=Vibrio fluvialis TaxID=676 RepID=UPI001E2BA913|nr:EAL domain-containing protein [Vibrio fluvialis]
MGKGMLRTPKKIVVLLVLLPVVLFFLSVPILERQYSLYLLNHKMDEVSKFLDARSKALNRMMLEQAEKLRFDCSEEDMSLMRNPNYYNKFVRIIGIISADGKTCSTVGVSLVKSELEGVRIPSTGFYMSTTPAYDRSESELLVSFKKDGNTVYWVLYGGWGQDMLTTPCEDCYYMTFHFLDSSFDHMKIKRGNPEIARQSSRISVAIQSPATQLMSQITLSAGDKLHDYVKHQLLIWGGPISLLFGLVIGFGYFMVRHYRNSIEGLIEVAIRDNEFVPFYQPIVDSRDGRIVGFEVLLRWQRGNEWIPPSQFIQAAETTGLIIPITEQLLKKVLGDVTKLNVEQWVSINLVAEHVETDILFNLLEKLHWPRSHQIQFEITERVPIKNLNHADHLIQQLSQHGYQFKIDDFGTGYGGFSYLQKLQIDSIKIDKMFIDTIETTDVKRNILDSIIASAREADIEVIAEGVETQKQVEYLTQRGVYLIQGFVYFRPMPLEEVLQHLQSPSGSESA